MEFDELFPEDQPVRSYEPEGENRIRFSKIVVVVSVAILILYTAIALFFVWHDKFIPDALTYSLFGAFSFELGVVGGIEIKKRAGGFR